MNDRRERRGTDVRAGPRGLAEMRAAQRDPARPVPPGGCGFRLEDTGLLRFSWSAGVPDCPDTSYRLARAAEPGLVHDRTKAHR